MPTSLLPLVLALVAAAPAPLPAAPAAPGDWQPSGFQLCSYASRLASRLGADGRLDGGAAAARLLDGATGQPLALLDPHVAKGPSLYVEFTSVLGALQVEGVVLGAGLSSHGDERAVAAVQLKLTNPGQEPVTHELVLELRPGGGDTAGLRPVPALAFDPAARFEQVGDVPLLTRDGRALLTWAGVSPEVELADPASGPDDVVARLRWNVEVDPGQFRFVEFRLAGPASTDTVAEDAWRSAFLKKTYASLDEELRWQCSRRGAAGHFDCASRPTWDVMIGGLHTFRFLGASHPDISLLTDRPYGRGPTDAAIEPEIAAIMLEWNLDEIGVPYLEQLIEQVDVRTADLSPARRLAYLHGLARAARLLRGSEREAAIAEAIAAHVDQAVAVEPWLDPDTVRQDLQAMWTLRGEEPPDLPQLRWAEVDDADSFDGLALSTARAISEGRADDAWSTFSRLLERRSSIGTGDGDGDGEVDGRYPMGMLTLLRAMLWDDHGDELHIFPAVAYGLIEVRKPIDTSPMYTRFGMVTGKVFHVGKREVGGWVRRYPKGDGDPTRVVLHLPEGLTVSRIKGPPMGGAVQVLDGGAAFLCDLDPRSGEGLRFNAVADKSPR